MADLVGTKSVFASKTAITGILLALFGVLNALGVLPAGFDGAALINGVFVVGGVLVAVFRAMATKKVTVAGPAA